MNPIGLKWSPQMDKNQRVLINMDSLAPPWFGTNLGERVRFLSDVIKWYHSTNQNFSKIYWNFLIGWMMWHCTANRFYINLATPRVSWKKLFYAKNSIAATPSPLLYILPTLLPPLFTSKKLNVHLAKIQGVVTPGTEGCRTSSTGCAPTSEGVLKHFQIR